MVPGREALVAYAAAVAAKQTVQRFVDEAVNGGRDEVIDELFTSDMTGEVREWFGAFRRSFPDVRMDIVELVAEAETVVGERIAALWGIEDSLDRYEQLGLDPAAT